MKVKQRGGLIALGTILVLTLAFRYYLTVLNNVPEVDIEIENIPLILGDWEGRDTAGLDIRSQGVLKLSRYVKREYTNSDGKTLLLYIGYWRKQSGDYQAAKHSPALCLPSNGWQTQPIAARELPLNKTLPDTPVTVKRITGQIRDRAHLFYYWFFAGKKDYSQESLALIRISLQTFFSGRSDGGIVEVSMPLEGTKGHQENLAERSRLIEDFLQSLYPELRKLINQQSAS